MLRSGLSFNKFTLIKGIIASLKQSMNTLSTLKLSSPKFLSIKVVFKST